MGRVPARARCVAGRAHSRHRHPRPHAGGGANGAGAVPGRRDALGRPGLRVGARRCALLRAAASPPLRPRARRAALEASAVTLGGVAVAGIVLGGHADVALSQQPSAKQDAEILNFALLLEFVQAAFHAEGLRRANLTGELKTFARLVSIGTPLQVR